MMQHKVNTQPLPENNFDILTKRGKQKKQPNNSFPQTSGLQRRTMSYDPSIIHTSINKLFE